MKKKLLWTLSALASAVVAVVGMQIGCNSVLGIDPATLVDGGVLPSSSDGGGGDPNSCQAYCDTIMKNCTGQYQEYSTTAICLAMCPVFDLGTPGDQSGDSRACRIYHAGAAAQDPAVHCPHAGPLGSPVCEPDPCVSFCNLDEGLCGQSFGLPQYANFAACQADCEPNDAGMGGYPYFSGGDAGDILYTGGNSLNCRLYHLEAASDPTTQGASTFHCPHTAQVSNTCH